MAFQIYREQQNGTWTQIRAVKLANTIASYVQQQIRRSGFKDTLKWDASEQQLLALEDEEFAGWQHRLVIDLKRTTEGNLSLYQLQHIWGWTLESWTPIALRLRPIFVDEKVKHYEQFKKKLELPSEGKLAANGGPVHEFLYLRHERPNGRWYWGRVGMVNGALLWPDVFDHFVQRIRTYGENSVSAGG